MSGSAITENRGYNTETSRSDDLSFTRHLRPHNPTYDKECKLLLRSFEGCPENKGMDEKTRNGVFEPFFTTKFQGRGMGMAAVYGIVMNHDGWISVDSELGKGTAVHIYLPAISAESKEQGEKVKQPEIELNTGKGTILRNLS